MLISLGMNTFFLEDALERAFFPLTLPITVGLGCISIAITLGAHLRHQAGPGWERGFPQHFIAELLGMFLLWLSGHDYSDATLRIHTACNRSSDYVERLENGHSSIVFVC